MPKLNHVRFARACQRLRSRAVPVGRRWTITAAVTLALTLGLTAVVAAERIGFEAPLAANGLAYEINPDAQGLLWITDFAAGEVWGVDPASGAYKVYAVAGSPSDARSVGGFLWWGDGMGDTLQRASTGDGSTQRWKIPGASGFYGSAVDADGRLWATSAQTGTLYRLEPGPGRVCEFGFGDASFTYIASSQGMLWLGDSALSRLLRLSLADNRVTWWTLPPETSPLGMTVDAAGRLWYADFTGNRLGRLDPATGRVALFNLPPQSLATMLALAGDQICYTAQGLPNVGCLNASGAGDSEFVSTVETGQVTPTCANVAATSDKVTVTTRSLAWKAQSYPDLPATGVTAFELPSTARPWGIALRQGVPWVVDQGRGLLVRVAGENARRVYLPLVK